MVSRNHPMIKHHRASKKAATASVRALIRMGRTVKRLHEKGYDEKTSKVLAGAAKRLVREANLLEREARKVSKKRAKGIKRRASKRRRYR